LKEYISTFIEKGLRPDRRALKDQREFKYDENILDNFSDSATCLLGFGNKILGVLKKRKAKTGENNFSKILIILRSCY
jgi:exosome complex RNA-binding protein Rrp42 (RNase PH superfamily)